MRIKVPPVIHRNPGEGIGLSTGHGSSSQCHLNLKGHTTLGDIRLQIDFASPAGLSLAKHKMYHTIFTIQGLEQRQHIVGPVDPCKWSMNALGATPGS